MKVENDSEERVCGVCPNPSSYSRKDCLGRVHRACTEHEPYLAGWVQDVAAECAAEGRAAAWFEAAAYGDRDDR
jgi:hypothetical protein